MKIITKCADAFIKELKQGVEKWDELRSEPEEIYCGVKRSRVHIWSTQCESEIWLIFSAFGYMQETSDWRCPCSAWSNHSI